MDLIDRIRNKEEAALRELMDEYGDLLLRTACLLVRDRQTAEEAVQDAFVQAYTKIDQLREREKLKSWLLTITVNRCRMRQRSWSWRNIFPGGGADELPEAGRNAAAGADEILLKDWEAGSLTQAVRGLDYLYRESIVLYYFHELTTREIAEQLNANESTIKSRLSRGRSLLKNILEKEERR
ncbi:sigma-70 family RNA polymerase sigma factor [Saccharibacillus sp. CPCC 101409]|nr:sigma-70 family RNA polymerase sigma factor [Saccharibacillus sp. CPCC 101409]MDO3411973.1 sigma-70 family RNA polymerase sigma factor [Saccharibacillus sp. CPCC 101409]